MIEVGDIIKIEVKQKAKQLYWPDYLHSNISSVSQIDEEHIYVKSFRKDIHGNAYVSGTDRYVLDDVVIEKVYDSGKKHDKSNGYNFSSKSTQVFSVDTK